MTDSRAQFMKGFPTNYELDPGVLSSPSERLFWFPPESTDGATARVRHQDGTRWFGYFPSERYSAGFTPFHATPDPDTLLYCGYDTTLVVPTNAPDTYQDVSFWAPHQALPATERGVLVLVNMLEIGVFDGRNLIWTSPRISYDGLENVRVEGDFVRGSAWGASTNRWHEFELNLSTRELEGGAYPY